MQKNPITEDYSRLGTPVRWCASTHIQTGAQRVPCRNEPAHFRSTSKCLQISEYHTMYNKRTIHSFACCCCTHQADIYSRSDTFRAGCAAMRAKALTKVSRSMSLAAWHVMWLPLPMSASRLMKASSTPGPNPMTCMVSLSASGRFCSCAMMLVSTLVLEDFSQSPESVSRMTTGLW